MSTLSHQPQRFPTEQQRPKTLAELSADSLERRRRMQAENDKLLAEIAQRLRDQRRTWWGRFISRIAI